MVLLNLLNSMLVRAQRKLQGIPWGAAHLYNKLVAAYLRRFYTSVAREIATRSPASLLDVGCGVGRLLIKLAHETNASLMVGLDISRAMALLARRNAEREEASGRISLVVADAHRMPIRGASLDFVVSTGTLHHIRRPREVFAECSRVLKAGGEAWIYEISYDAPWSETKATSRRLGAPSMVVKFAAALHGLPRRAYEEGYIRRELRNSGIPHTVVYEGAVTKLVLYALGEHVQ